MGGPALVCAGFRGLTATADIGTVTLGGFFGLVVVPILSIALVVAAARFGLRLPGAKLPRVLAVVLPIASGLTWVVWTGITRKSECVGLVSPPEDRITWILVFTAAPIVLSVAASVAMRDSALGIRVVFLRAVGAMFGSAVVAGIIGLILILSACPE